MATTTKIALLFVPLLASLTGFAHTQKLTYNIKRNDQVIGKLSLSREVEGENVFLKITSKVNTRFVFKVDVQTEDLAHFKNGQLMFSDLTRIVNGKPKEKKKTTFHHNSYQLLAGNKQQTLNKTIGYNMMLLYLSEPNNCDQVYSDNFQCFVAIKKQAAHHYRIKLPDGNFNDYFFENGLCKLIVINHSLYTIKMELAA